MLVEMIVTISDSFEAYGYRRMRAALRHRGIVANHKKIRRLMRDHDLQPRRRRRYVVTTDGVSIFPNLAKGTVPEGPNQLWVVEDGVTNLDDMLEERLAALKADRDRAQTALDRMHAAKRPPAVIAPELITQFGQLMRTNLTEGTIPFRKAWLQSIVDPSKSAQKPSVSSATRQIWNRLSPRGT